MLIFTVRVYLLFYQQTSRNALPSQCTPWMSSLTHRQRAGAVCTCT